MEELHLKNKFHKLIDDFSDTKMLEQLYEILSDYHNRKTGIDIFDELTRDQRERLKTSLKQAQTGRTVSENEVKGKVQDWLTK